MKVWGVSVVTTLHTFLSAPACIACADMVYSKELERDVTTTAMAKAIPENFGIYSFIEPDRFDFLRPKGE